MPLSSLLYLATPRDIFVALVCGILLIGTWFLFPHIIHQRPYPPGPPIRSLLFGNQSDLPTLQPWLTYTQWKKQYGDIVHFRISSQHTIILNSINGVKELFERRSRIYSDRPQFKIMELMGWYFNSGFLPYGNLWRRHRRIYQQFFRADVLSTHQPIQTQKIHDMLYNLLMTPNDFLQHYKTVAGGTILSTVYGYDVQPQDDPFVAISEAAVGKFSESFFPGAKAVNAFPLLSYFPNWFPGAGFKRFAQEAHQLTSQMLQLPFDIAKKNTQAGITPYAMVVQCLSRDWQAYENDPVLKGVAATSYAAGSDTTSSAMGTFSLAMAMYPEVQKKAQQEIENVIGPDRLMTLDDRNTLPYIEAIYREIFRWRPVLPLGLAHNAFEDDVYDGYFIPKGTSVIPNIWAISHDPEKYEHPDEFNPDRHFNQDGTLNDDEVIVFGFGRRICPGRHFASNTVWLAIAAVLSAFIIEKKKDSSGKEIPLTAQYTDGVISHPLPYECSVKPRSEKARQLILQVAGKVPH